MSCNEHIYAIALEQFSVVAQHEHVRPTHRIGGITAHQRVMTCHYYPWSEEPTIIRLNQVLEHGIVEDIILFNSRLVVYDPIGVEVYDMSITQVVAIEVIVTHISVYVLLRSPE
jgi:hypothetical protein